MNFVHFKYKLTITFWTQISANETLLKSKIPLSEKYYKLLYSWTKLLRLRLSYVYKCFRVERCTHFRQHLRTILLVGNRNKLTFSMYEERTSIFREGRTIEVGHDAVRPIPRTLTKWNRLKSGRCTISSHWRWWAFVEPSNYLWYVVERTFTGFYVSYSEQ